MKQTLLNCRLLLLLLFGGLFTQIFAQQASTYTVNSTMPTYTYLPGDGTSLVTGFSWANQVFTNVPIGFTFYFEGKPYTSVGVSSNGFIWFGSGTASTTESNPISDATLGTGTIAGVVSAFGTSLEAFPTTMTDGEAGTPEISYGDVSTGCSEVFVVQWKGAAATSNAPFEGAGSSSSFGSQTLGDDNRIDLQIRLDAVTNQISILVRTFPYPYPQGDASAGEIGIRGASNADFTSLEYTNTCGLLDTHPFWQVQAQTANNAETCTNDPCYPAAGGSNYSTNASYNFVPSACSYTAPTSFTNAGCGNNGTIAINVSNGTGVFAYDINDGVVNDTNSTGQFSGLGAGTYITAVTNGVCAVSGCTTITSSSSSATASNNGPVCLGGSVTLSTPLASGAVYHWTGPNGFTSSQQNPVLPNVTAADTGIYTIVDSIGNCVTGPGTTDVSVSGTVTPATITANPSKICSNDSAQLCVTGTFAHYAWNTIITDNDPGDTTQCIYVNQAGDYYVSVSNGGGCTGSSNHEEIFVYPVPSVAITVEGDTLASFGQVGYQWFLNGNPINGATSSVYVATTPGSYAVQVTDTNGCKTLSQPVTTAIQNLSNNIGFEIYPNPASTGSIQLSISNECLGCDIEMYDAIGQSVYQGKVTSHKQEIDISKLSKGVYTIKVSGGVRQFVKE